MKNNFTEKGNIVEIECKRHNGDIITTEISSEDFVKVSKVQTTWYIHTDNKSQKMYVRGNGKDEDGNRKILLLHRVITDCPESYVVNHVSGNTLDNTRENIEVTTQRENVRHGKQQVEVIVRKSKRLQRFFEVVWIIDNEIEFPAGSHPYKEEALIRKLIIEMRQKPVLMKYVDFPERFKELGFDYEKLPFERAYGEELPKLLTGKQIRKQLKEVDK